LLVIAKYYHY